MYRKITALILLFIFIGGTTGFSLTIHSCSHSGTRIFSSLGKPDHDCSTENTTPDSGKNCCHPEEKSEHEKLPDSCCSPDENASELSHSGDEHSHSCCTDDSALLRVSTLSQSPSYVLFPVLYPVEHEEGWFASFISFFTTVFSPENNSPPDKSMPNRQSMLCVFRI